MAEKKKDEKDEKKPFPPKKDGEGSGDGSAESKAKAESEADVKEAEPGGEDDVSVPADDQEGDGEGGEDEGGNEPNNQEVQDLISALAEHNINLDVEAVKTPKDLVTHLTIALRALKGVLQPGGATGGAPVEEQPSQTLSHDVAVAPSPEFLAMKSKLASSEMRHLTRRIDNLVLSGQASPAKAKEWTSKLTEHQLGLADEEPDAVLRDIRTQVDFCTNEVPEGTLYSEAGKRLVAKNGQLLSADEESPADTQKWLTGDGNSLDPERHREVVKQFCQANNIPYKE